jgi:hypothetical protein
MKSPQTLHFLGAPSAMGHFLEIELNEIDMALTALFRRHLTARELKAGLRPITGYFDERLPGRKTRNCFLHRLRNTWRESKGVMLREFLGHTECVFPENS